MKSKSHRISIPSILESGPHSIDRIGYLLNREKLDNIYLFYDPYIKEILGDRIEEKLNKYYIKFKSNTIKSIDICGLIEVAFSIPNDVNAIVAIGGGRVIDGAKYIGFLRKRPFVSIPTSTSNDGFSSPVASVYINGKRTTVPAKVPYGVIVDTNVISNAPEKFIYSGIGDLVSNITALWDWKHEEIHNKGYREDFAVMISKKSVDSFLTLPFNSIKEQQFIQNLVDSLIMNGISMEISGSSAPSSGSEHLISHALDKLVDNPYLHGIQVGISSYIISKLQNNKVKEISNFLEDTGFWNYTKTLNIKGDDFIRAIDMAPYIKPQRYTILHVEGNRKKAKDIVKNDSLLNRVLK